MTPDPAAVEAMAAALAEQSPDDDDLRDWLTDRAEFVLDALTAAGVAVVPVGEVERLRSVIDRCPFDGTPLQHDAANPQLEWWCGTCGHITDRPSLAHEETR